MPVVKRGFLFKFFDKIICGLVLLGVLVSAAYAVLRSSGGANPAVVENALSTINNKMNAKPKPVPFPEQVFEQVGKAKEGASAEPINVGAFWPVFPKAYPPQRVGLNKQFDLEFDAPLTEGTVHVSGEGEEASDLLRVVEHPVGDDYAKVRLESFGEEGKASVIGTAGDGTEQEYPIVVDRNAGKTAYPPDIRLSSSEGAINVRITPNKTNADEEVEVVSYQIWRRDWSDPLGTFEQVANVKAEALGAGGGGRTAAPLGAAMGPLALRATPARAGGETQGPALVWKDTDVKPGKSYTYKVRTVGQNTFPAESEFTEPMLVEASPSVDFKWTRSIGEKVGCDVVKSFAGKVQQKTFWVSVGDEIGGVASGGLGQDLNFMTGFYLVDFHRQIILPGVGVTDRMIYADGSGNLHQRLRGETKSDLWSQAGQTQTPGAGVPLGVRGPSGPPAGPFR